MLVWVSKLTTLISRPSRPPASFISPTAKLRTSYIGLPAASRPPDRSYMLAMTIGSAAAALRTSAGARTVAATPPFNNALRFIPMMILLLSVIIFRSSAAALSRKRYRRNGDPQPAKRARARFVGRDHNVASGLHACLELPKYRLWLPIGLSLPPPSPTSTRAKEQPEPHLQGTGTRV